MKTFRDPPPPQPGSQICIFIWTRILKYLDEGGSTDLKGCRNWTSEPILMIRGAFESRARAGFGKKILNEKSWLEILFRGATFHRYRYLPVPKIVSTIDNRQAGGVADRVRRNRAKASSKEIVSLGRAFGFMQKYWKLRLRHYDLFNYQD